MKINTIQAEHGDCFILEFGTEANPKYILIDGGPSAEIYEHCLKPQLQKISDNGGKLEVLVLSHVDKDHVKGLLEFMAELEESKQDETTPLIKIEQCWHNSFDKTLDTESNIETRINSIFSNSQSQNSLANTNFIIKSINQGNKFKHRCKQLLIPINSTFNNELISVEDFPDPFTIDNITIQIVGPTKINLAKLKKDWEKWFEKHEDELSGIDPALASYADNRAPNLSSLMFVVNQNGKTILFTGDGRGDHLIDGLIEQGLLHDEDDSFYVNVLKVPHHGSENNVEKKFFKQVLADKYIISANGKNDNPDIATLKMIVEAADELGRKITIYVTNETDSTRQLLQGFPTTRYDYELYIMAPDVDSFIINI